MYSSRGHSKKIPQQIGASLITVLALITIGGLLALSIYSWGLWKQKQAHQKWIALQAELLVESGAAWELSHYKEGGSSVDTIATLSDTASKFFDLSSLDDQKKNNSTYELVHRPDLPLPTTDVSKEGAWLKITSSLEWEEVSRKLTAMYGKSLSDSLFNAALIITGEGEVASNITSNITGKIFKKGSSVAIGLSPLDPNFQIATYTQKMGTVRAEKYHLDLQNQLKEIGGTNGDIQISYSQNNVFAKDSLLFSPLGSALIENFFSRCKDIVGPGKIMVHGDIIVKGCVNFKDVELYAGRDLIFEDSVTTTNVMAYAGKSAYIKGKSNLGIDLVAREKIVISKQSQTTLTSVLTSTGYRESTNNNRGRNNINRNPSPSPNGAPSDNSNTPAPGGIPLGNPQQNSQAGKFGIYIEDEAKVKGFLLSSSPYGEFKLKGKASSFDGFALVENSTSIEGNIIGILWTKKLDCPANPGIHCIEGKINRKKLSPAFTLPMQFDPKGLKVAWKRVYWELK